MLTLSIILPIYKVEKYIGECLRSIISQMRNRKDIEVILIDDGSPDNSVMIALDIIKDIDNVRIYRQPNSGLSEARNSGLDKATGEYVWFVDSDDSIVRECLEGIIESLERYSPDLLQLNYQKTYENGNSPVPYCSSFSNMLSGREMIRNGELVTPAQFTIYRRLFLLENSLRFFPGILHEDAEFKPRVTYLAKSIVQHKPIVYNYLQRKKGNIMSSFSFRNANDIIIGINNLCLFMKKNVRDEDKSGFRKIISMYFNNILNGYSKLKDEEKLLVFNLINKNRHIYKEMIASKCAKYILEGLILSLNTKFALKLYSRFKKNGYICYNSHI